MVFLVIIEVWASKVVFNIHIYKIILNILVQFAKVFSKNTQIAVLLILREMLSAYFKKD